VHGIGLVIGSGASVATGCLLYHGVTLGIKGSARGDGFPAISRDCVLGAGCKILGKIVVGEECVIGPNVVLLESVEAGSIVKCPAPLISKRRKAQEPVS
jgi:serine O-acetyltransferase